MRASSQQVGHGDDLAGDVHQLLVLAHGQLAHAGVGVGFAHAAFFHQQPLGAVDQLAVGELFRCTSLNWRRTCDCCSNLASATCRIGANLAGVRPSTT